MRFKTSRQTTYSAPPPAPKADLHYKKDGSLDMRFKSSQIAAATVTSSSIPSGVRLKKDGTPDMRFKSSRQFVEQMEKLNLSSNSDARRGAASGVDRGVPVTASGLPDMRKNAAKEWVQQQASAWEDDELPQWVPCLKDGSPDMSKAVAREFMRSSSSSMYERDARERYYQQKIMDDLAFMMMMEQQRSEYVPMVEEPPQLEYTNTLRQAFSTLENDQDDTIFVSETNVPQLDYKKDLKIDDKQEPLGSGAFGVVRLGKWNDKQVAIKTLHMSRLTKKDRKLFKREIMMLSVLGEHPNVVQLYGYSLEPLSLVMEYVPLGSLNYLLHYCEDPTVEARVTDGRIKLNILLGIAHGMTQLHACGVTHGDLKPQNVLISNDFHAKIADFGLATLRAKTATTTASSTLKSSRNANDEDEDGAAGGTAAYMAPELLQSSSIANEKTDVFSFGILMNELLQEEEPYQRQLRQFQGKGPYAAVLYAKEGHRPDMRENTVTPQLKRLIESCWHTTPTSRPSFARIAEILAACKVPHMCDISMD